MSRSNRKAHAAGESAVQMTAGMLQTGLSGMQTYVQAMAAVVGESKNPEAAETFAHLLTKVAQVASELRKAEAAERKAADAMGETEILEWYRRLDDTAAEAFLRKLGAVRRKGSGLA